MPIYEYVCEDCEEPREELILRRTDEDDLECHRCKSRRLVRRLSRPAALSSSGCGPAPSGSGFG